MHRHPGSVGLPQGVDVLAVSVWKILMDDFYLALELDLLGSSSPLRCGYGICVANCWIMPKEKGADEQHQAGEDCVADRSGGTRP